MCNYACVHVCVRAGRVLVGERVRGARVHARAWVWACAVPLCVGVCLCACLCLCACASC